MLFGISPGSIIYLLSNLPPEKKDSTVWKSSYRERFSSTGFYGIRVFICDFIGRNK
jgi:hypothetical protein